MMLDLLTTLRSVDGTANDNTPNCLWQDLPGSVKLDNEDKEVALTARYNSLLRRLQESAPLVIETLDQLATIADKTAHSDAATDARVAGGWLRRLSGRDFTRTTWDSDYSSLDGFWACLRDAQTALETAFRDDRAESQDFQFRIGIVVGYLNDLAQLQPEITNIERSRTTLAQKAFQRLWGTFAALRSNEVVHDDDFWNEESVDSTTR